MIDLTTAGDGTTLLSDVLDADSSTPTPLADGADAFRTINVDAGSIYLLDETKIDFGAATNLLVEVDSWVIVDDLNNDGTYEARVVAKADAETLNGEYYIIGETGWPPAVAPASYTYVGRNAAVGTSIIFTAKMPGTDGNGLKVSGSSGSTSVSFSYNDNNNNTLTINYNSSVHTVADLVRAFADSGLDAEIARLYEISFIGDDTNFLNNILSLRSETLAGGGVATDPTQTGTVPSGGVLTLEDTTTYEYVVVVNNVDDNAPVFGDAVQGELCQMVAMKILLQTPEL